VSLVDDGRRGAAAPQPPERIADPPEEPSLRERELIDRISWLIELRWLAAVALAVGGSAVAYFFYGDDLSRITAVLALGVGVALYNAVFWVGWRRFLPAARGRIVHASVFANLQIGIDLLALTAYAWLTGGYASPVLSYYVFHTIFASILLPRRAAFAWATVSVVLGGSVIGSAAPPESIGWAPEGVSIGRLPLTLFGGFATLQYVSVYLATSIALRLRFREREAQQLMAETHAKAEALRRAHDNLQATQLMQTAYMRRVSHELRSPLAAISSSLDLVAQGYTGDVADKTRDILARAYARIEGLLRIVNDLLTLSRARTARVREYLEPVSIPITVREVLQLLAERADQRGVTLANRVPDALPTILSDREEIVQLFTNLTANAVKYTSSGGRVMVLGERVGDDVVIRVSDTGIGIAPEDIPHIYEEFYRTKRGKEFQAVGSGLGLAITRAIVAKHHGTIEVESEVGVGSTFTVRLPVDLEEPPAPALGPTDGGPQV
jgi:signal transduction histidine kinase